MIKEGKDMFTQAKSKKAVSVIVGYVLLISFAIVIGVIVYQWMKTYVPKEDINCPDGTSLFIKRYEYTPELLTLYLKNNGKCDILRPLKVFCLAKNPRFARRTAS